MLLEHLTPIPLPPPAAALRGALFRSAMPFRHDDGQLLDEAVAAGVRAVVWLTSAEEALLKSGRDLAAEYAARGLACVHLPIPDYEPPSDRDALVAAIEVAAGHLRAGEGVLVHCAAGIGRTGLFLACLIGRLSTLAGPDCVRWVRARVSGAVETDEQRAFVDGFVGRR
jgi:protein-tyrosine phosphatase